MKYRKKGVHIRIAKKEIKKAKREKWVIRFLFVFFICCIIFLLGILATKLILTGYSTYLQSKGGYITEVEIFRLFPSSHWFGIYGLALRVPGFDEIFYEDGNNGYILRRDLFFDCIEADAVGGPEVYASPNSTIDFDTLQPANLAEVDAYFQCVGLTECPSNTFTNTMSVMIGTRNVSGIPSTFTHKYDGDNDVFDVGVLKDSAGRFAFVSHLAVMQRGYTSNVTVNYQMILPVPELESLRYYFFIDPNDVCPGGGIGENINANVYGYVKDDLGAYLSNVTVVVAGYLTQTDSNGFYN